MDHIVKLLILNVKTFSDEDHIQVQNANQSLIKEMSLIDNVVLTTVLGVGRKLKMTFTIGLAVGNIQSELRMKMN